MMVMKQQVEPNWYLASTCGKGSTWSLRPTSRLEHRQFNLTREYMLRTVALNSTVPDLDGDYSICFTTGLDESQSAKAKAIRMLDKRSGVKLV